MTIVMSVLVFGLLVLAHEFGHFIVARSNGILVEEFAIGMGPKLIAVKKGDTLYSIRILPIGGFCRMLGEDSDSVDPRAMSNKSPWARIAVVIAGAVFNFALAFIIILLSGLFQGYTSNRISEVIEGYPAMENGILSGDRIVAIDGRGMHIYRDIQIYMLENTGEPITVTINRDGKKLDIPITPKIDEKTGAYLMGIRPKSLYGVFQGHPVLTVKQLMEGSPAELAGLKQGDKILEYDGKRLVSYQDLLLELSDNAGEEITLTISRGTDTFKAAMRPAQDPGTGSYYLGFKPETSNAAMNEYEAVAYTKATAGELISSSFWTVWFNIRVAISGLIKLATFQVAGNEVMGPVGIVQFIGESYEVGLADSITSAILNVASLAALLSANLGAINLLPLPAMDGGRLVFLLLEVIRRKPIDPNKEGMVHFAGFVLLMILMVFIFYNDISRLVTGA